MDPRLLRTQLPVSRQLPLMAATLLLTLAAATSDAAGVSPRTLVLLLVLAQTSALGWMTLRCVDEHRKWATPGIVLAGAWFLTFVVPTWIYVLDPSLADGLPMADAVAITTVALLSVLCGSELARLLWPPSSPGGAPAAIEIEPATLSRAWTAGWVALGFTAMGVLFAVNGGLVEWITNLDKVGAMARGLTYVIGVALVVKHVAITFIACRLRRAQRIDLGTVALVALVVLILVPLGARLFIAMLLVEVLLLHALLVRPLALRVLAPVGVACALVLIFGYGTVKRYQTFRAANPTLDKGFADYVRTRAVDEVGAAYANNYADGVLLTAQARSVVPHRVDYEYGKAFIRLALQPIPSPLRPAVKRDPDLERLIGERDGNAHAVPLQAEGYVQFGLIGVVGLFALIGAALTALERGMSRSRLTLPTLIVLVVATVQIPLVIRSGVPLGAAVAGLYIIGAYIVARTVARSTSRTAVDAEKPRRRAEVANVART